MNSPGFSPAPTDFERAKRPLKPLHPSKVLLISLIASIAPLLGCNQDPKPRTYSEVASQEPILPPAATGMEMGDAPFAAMGAVDIKVTWKVPLGWIQKDSAVAMRIGSYTVPGKKTDAEPDSGALDVSVVKLAGAAGGLEANLNRWMGQVGIISTPEERTAFLKTAERFRTKTGQEGLFIDLTAKLSGDMTQSKSIFGAFIAKPAYTVFVKAMGDRARLIAYKSELKGFCQSLSIHGPKA